MFGQPIDPHMEEEYDKANPKSFCEHLLDFTLTIIAFAIIFAVGYFFIPVA